MKKKTFIPSQIVLVVNQGRRPCSLNVRLTEEEKKLVEIVAEKYQLSVSDLARSVLLQVMENMLEQSD